MNRTRLAIILLVVFGLITPIWSALPVTTDGKSPFVEVIKSVRESVVQIKVEGKEKASAQNPMFDDDFFKYFFPQQPQERAFTSMGSGFIFKQDPKTNEAFILTNNHVVAQGSKGTITVTLADKVQYKAETVGLDPTSDLAVIKIKPDAKEKLTLAKLGDSSNLDIGDWAIAIGNPFGDAGLDRTVTVGVISAIGRSNLNFGNNTPVYQDYIQTDAAINPGNSGGPLINIKGEVIGVNAAITSTSGGNVGIGFAIPVNLAKKVSDDLMASGKVVRAYLGISPQEITPELRSSLDLPEVAGVLVAKVEDKTPASKAGIKKGDVIVEFNNEKIQNVSKFRIAVATAKIGASVPVAVLRDNKSIKLTAVLEEYPDSLSSGSDTNTTTAAPSSGLTVEALDGPFATAKKITGDKGVVITQIQPGTPGAKAGLQLGDIVIEINGKEISTVSEFTKTMDTAKKDIDKKDNKIILLYVQDKNGNYKYVTLNFAE